jgi:urease subunit gamma/beta
LRLTAWEEERLQVFTAAQLARRRQDRGLLLNAPEATAIICDAMFEAARDGAGYSDVEAAGRAALAPSGVLPGVAALVREIRLEVSMDDGTRLVVLLDPLADPDDGHSDDDVPGAIRISTAPTAATLEADGGSDIIELVVTSTSDRVVRVSSHYPFERVNRRLVFDRVAVIGRHLDLPAGSTERWRPGESRTVRLVRYRVDR